MQIRDPGAVDGQLQRRAARISMGRKASQAYAPRRIIAWQKTLTLAPIRQATDPGSRGGGRAAAAQSSTNIHGPQSQSSIRPQAYHCLAKNANPCTDTPSYRSGIPGRWTGSCRKSSCCNHWIPGTAYQDVKPHIVPDSGCASSAHGNACQGIPSICYSRDYIPGIFTSFTAWAYAISCGATACRLHGYCQVADPGSRGGGRAAAAQSLCHAPCTHVPGHRPGTDLLPNSRIRSTPEHISMYP